ncbi:tripeptide aminopeptidase [Lutibacter oceani]|uniref:Peptidase T n=1 Tax=Lutibacter oceani TaxID=1853311 RepID=A0A3D9RQN0_9FLAO|nr:peptidase T [Lutibacter oceani]REE81778.1 tripeptide aminopeptidase [Lutibacter oceani]
MQKIIDRFVKYITVDTQSDPDNPAFPSTEKQWDLAHILVGELKEIGMQDVTIDDNCYIMATLPSNVDFKVPTIGFIAHIDTSPDYTGTNVKPQFHPNYDGKDIVLNKEENIVLSPSYFDDLLLYKGQTLITTDGTTLLGADDKAGITEIVSAMEYLINHPEIKHGKIRICFTPDEEVGKGAHMFDVEKFGAEWAYTMDGSQVGELEYENFNAAGAKVTVNGKIVHPGYAKGKMINSMLIANEFIAALPKNEIPQETEGYEGFFHLHGMEGEVEKTTLEYIIRDHDMELFEGRKALFQKVADDLNEKLGSKLVEVEVKDQYFNMRKQIEPVMHIVDIAEEAMKQLNIKPIIKAIRGGTDGSQLSYKGLPCPNIFAGGHNFHGRYEYVPAESIQLATEVIVKIAKITAERAQ